jgi:hypothetical protein
MAEVHPVPASGPIPNPAHHDALATLPVWIMLLFIVLAFASFSLRGLLLGWLLLLVLAALALWGLGWMVWGYYPSRYSILADGLQVERRHFFTQETRIIPWADLALLREFSGGLKRGQRALRFPGGVIHVVPEVWPRIQPHLSSSDPKGLS